MPFGGVGEPAERRRRPSGRARNTTTAKTSSATIRTIVSRISAIASRGVDRALRRERSQLQAGRVGERRRGETALRRPVDVDAAGACPGRGRSALPRGRRRRCARPPRRRGARPLASPTPDLGQQPSVDRNGHGDRAERAAVVEDRDGPLRGAARQRADGETTAREACRRGARGDRGEGLAIVPCERLLHALLAGQAARGGRGHVEPLRSSPATAARRLASSDASARRGLAAPGQAVVAVERDRQRRAARAARTRRRA